MWLQKWPTNGPYNRKNIFCSLKKTICNRNMVFAQLSFRTGELFYKDKDKDKDKDLFIGLQEFVVGYSKAPEQPQSSARPICHSHAMTRTGREPATIHIAA